ncbi:MAG: hypothetical protein FWE91_02000 [Defluviitaleaceae bacterium]|nr:hypothetical protein [Defluviitaleaceae bacterium]MCL2836081.1 hypothetical protein [Defluviitaleaceae bacterium]
MMHLGANVVLSGKYIILSSLFDSDNYIMYLAKAPSLGEEFLLTEFFPREMAIRDEDDFVTISPENAGVFESNLDKFTSDCRRLSHLTANRFWGVRDILSEMGTAFAVSKKPLGDMLAQFISEMEEDAVFSENMIDSVYETLRSTAKEQIPLHATPDMIYAENTGSLTFMFDYRFGFSEQEMLENMAKLIYCLLSKKFYEEDYNPNLIPEENKYHGVITGILDSPRMINSFAEADDEVNRSLRRHAKEAPFYEYIGSAISFIILMILLGAAVAFGVFMLTRALLG